MKSSVTAVSVFGFVLSFCSVFCASCLYQSGTFVSVCVGIFSGVVLEKGVASQVAGLQHVSTAAWPSPPFVL